MTSPCLVLRPLMTKMAMALGSRKMKEEMAKTMMMVALSTSQSSTSMEPRMMMMMVKQTEQKIMVQRKVFFTLLNCQVVAIPLVTLPASTPNMMAQMIMKMNKQLRVNPQQRMSYRMQMMFQIMAVMARHRIPRPFSSSSMLLLKPWLLGRGPWLGLKQGWASTYPWLLNPCWQPWLGWQMGCPQLTGSRMITGWWTGCTGCWQSGSRAYPVFCSLLLVSRLFQLFICYPIILWQILRPEIIYLITKQDDIDYQTHLGGFQQWGAEGRWGCTLVSTSRTPMLSLFQGRKSSVAMLASQGITRPPGTRPSLSIPMRRNSGSQSGTMTRWGPRIQWAGACWTQPRPTPTRAKISNIEKVQLSYPGKFPGVLDIQVQYNL